ncbi:mycothiol system anti-sigma-R factor [Micrococcus cohnii]|uniref:Mycothiol system anti-sigma-R factor n=1 Tax=Micrococcus cohnii TaxID=993416 RepID=A0A7W7M2F9_9MICC|nr:mycothiol system anti-sigma-R factor [Micrococcus cohnii]MBB4734912.1 mycothiol system anti-sigma-R factor [Micrococcus cohnii]
MNRTDCCDSLGDDHLRRIYEYLDGALSAEQLEAVREHLRHCPTCARQRELEELIRARVRRCCQEKAPEQLRASIRMRLTQVRITDVS